MMPREFVAAALLGAIAAGLAAALVEAANPPPPQVLVDAAPVLSAPAKPTEADGGPPKRAVAWHLSSICVIEPVQKREHQV